MSKTTLSDILPMQVSEKHRLIDLMSDHLPQLHRLNGINILNWNILTKNYFIGFADAFGEQPVLESDEEYNQRLQNIATYLVKTAEIFDLSIIALQEAYVDFLSYLPDNFKKSWHILIDNKWKITCYKKCVWELDNSTDLATLLKMQFSKHKIKSVLAKDFQGIVLKNIKSNKKIVFYNVYTQHEDGPENLESAILAIQELHKHIKALTNVRTYIMGDFNRRLPDPSIYARDNATHLVPPMFRNTTKPQKLYDYTDCCFEFDTHHIIENNGLLLDTQTPGAIFNRPLVTLKHALTDTHYTEVIFPFIHHIRLVNPEKTRYGHITLDAFTLRLEHANHPRIKDIRISKNRYSVISMQITFAKSNDILNNLGITNINNRYVFQIVPQTSDHDDMKEATPEHFSQLSIIQIINEFGTVIDLTIPNFAKN